MTGYGGRIWSWIEGERRTVRNRYRLARRPAGRWCACETVPSWATPYTRFRNGVIGARLPATGAPLPVNWALQDTDDWLEVVLRSGSSPRLCKCSMKTRRPTTVARDGSRRSTGLSGMLETCGSVGTVHPAVTVVAEDGSRREDVSLLDDVVLEGARRTLTAPLEAEVDAYLAELAGERDGRGRRLVVRNGHAQPREVMTRPARWRCARRGSMTSASMRSRGSVGGLGR
jgi:hypothetical protein